MPAWPKRPSIGDREQLTLMAEQARAATGIDALTAVADRGYSKGEQILQRHETTEKAPVLAKSPLGGPHHEY